MIDYSERMSHLSPEQIAEKMKPNNEVPPFETLLKQQRQDLDKLNKEIDTSFLVAKHKAKKVYKDSGMVVREALKEIFGEETFKGL